MALSEIHKDEIAFIGNRLERAILTLGALPDRERPRGMKSSHPEVLLEGSAGDYPRIQQVKRFEPTPKDHDLMLPTLEWLRLCEKDEVRLVFARAYEVPWWRIGAELGIHEKTARRWYGVILRRIWGHLETKKQNVVDDVPAMSA